MKEMCEIVLEEKSSCLGNFERENGNKVQSCLNWKSYEFKSTLNFCEIYLIRNKLIEDQKEN